MLFHLSGTSFLQAAVRLAQRLARLLRLGPSALLCLWFLVSAPSAAAAAVSEATNSSLPEELQVCTSRFPRASRRTFEGKGHGRTVLTMEQEETAVIRCRKMRKRRRRKGRGGMRASEKEMQEEEQ